METALTLSCTMISCQVLTQNKEGKVTLDPLIHMYLFKTGHAPGDPLVGPFLFPDPYIDQI